jgi:hypothetical protein
MHRRVLVVCAAAAIFGVAALPAPAGADTLKVTGFAPASGPVGTTVVITGGGMTGSSSVKFNGVSAQFKVNTSKKITATVPLNATSGRITVTRGAFTVTTTNSFDVTTGPGAATPWPMFQHDMRHTGKTTVNGPSGSSVHPEWTYKAPSWIKNQTTMGPDGTLYIGAGKFPLCALNPAGTENFCTHIGGFVDQSAATVGNPFTKTDASGSRTVQTLYIGDRNNIFWAVDSEGATLWHWKIPLDGDVRASAIIDPATSRVFTMCGCTVQARLYAFDKFGTIQWQLSLPQARDMSPAALQFGAHFRLYVPTNNGDLYAVDDMGTIGVVAWHVHVGAQINGSPSIGPDGTIYVPFKGGVSAVKDNGSSAEVLAGWPVAINGDVDTAPALSNGKLFVGSFESPGRRTVTAVDIANKSVLWSVTGAGNPQESFALTPSPVIGGNGWVYAADGPDVYAFDPASATPSTPKWHFTLGANAIALTVGDGVLYAGAQDTKLYALVS